MRIGVNLIYLRPSKVGGSEVYVRNLIDHLDRRDDLKLVLFCRKEVAPLFAALKKSEVIVVSEKDYSYFHRFKAENYTLRKYLTKIDLLFTPANFAPLLLQTTLPQVVTVFDLQHLWFKNFFAIHKRLARSLLFKKTFRKCLTLITISDFTRADIIEKYGVDPELVTTIHCGVDRSLKIETEAVKSVVEDYGLSRNYFIYPAMLAPHKNHFFLLEAFARFRAENRSEAMLVFTGDRGSNYSQLVKKLAELNLSNCVKHLGFLKHEEVLALITGAQAMLFPSIFEGFGLPILEAMICGTPVVASDTTSIPEVAGNAALLIEPDDQTGWAKAMAVISDDQAKRNLLIEKGYINIGRFSWDNCAEQTSMVFKKVLAGSGSGATVEQGRF